MATCYAHRTLSKHKQMVTYKQTIIVYSAAAIEFITVMPITYTLVMKLHDRSLNFGAINKHSEVSNIE